MTEFSTEFGTADAACTAFNYGRSVQLNPYFLKPNGIDEKMDLHVPTPKYRLPNWDSNEMNVMGENFDQDQFDPPVDSNRMAS